MSIPHNHPILQDPEYRQLLKARAEVVTRDGALVFCGLDGEQFSRFNAIEKQYGVELSVRLASEIAK